VLFRSFIKHYLMIVLSILTALGLEQLIIGAHEHHAAQRASAQIEEEIRLNLADVHAARIQDAAQSKMLDSVLSDLVKDVKSNVPDAQIAEHIHSVAGSNHFNLNLRWPTLRHEAWDVAVADQSAGWIDTERRRRYAAVYAYQRDATIGMSADIALLINGPRLIDALTDLRAGSVQPSEFLHVVGQMSAMLNESQGNLAQLEDRLDKALTQQPTHHPATEHSAY
jgi:hypothetical protein